jgi:hypothetical protein
MDNAAVPVAVAANYWTTDRLVPATTHSFRLAYVDKNGQRSPLSEPAYGTTWGYDDNGDGLPDDWQGKHWGPSSADWPDPRLDSDRDGADNRQEFFAGTDPTDPRKVLRLWWTTDGAGTRLNWNTEKGAIYQVQISRDLRAWDDFGLPRFAAGTSDSILADQENGKAIYRAVRVR